jgi:hypothetical protein
VLANARDLLLEIADALLAASEWQFNVALIMH